MTSANPSPLEVATRIASDVSSAHAIAVDHDARFPSETLDALKKARLMSALVPRERGGLGCGMVELAAMCEALGQHCASSAMVFAMHHIQVASILRHAISQKYYERYVAELVETQPLIASATSEVGIG